GIAAAVLVRTYFAYLQSGKAQDAGVPISQTWGTGTRSVHGKLRRLGTGYPVPFRSLLSLKTPRPKYGNSSKRKHIKKRDQLFNWSHFLYRLTKTRKLRQQVYCLQWLPRSWPYHPESTLQPHPATPPPHQSAG